jgi:glycosyltransferase involved in cell wall biosynthesis
MRKGAFVSWVPSCGRSQGFIDALDLVPIYSSYLRQRDLFSAPLKYGPQFLDTMRRLKHIQPDVVFVMNPPVFAVAAVALYARQTRAQYVIDSHSGAFESRKWRWSLPLQRLLGRRAAAVIVTNPVHKAEVERWPAPAVIVADPPPRLSTVRSSITRLGPSEPFVFVIATYGPDEAIPQVIEAARQLPEVRFRVSGDVRRAPAALVQRCPSNVELTGYVALPVFWEHVERASAILTLTDQENTILRGGWEAMFAGRPLLTSGTRTLREYFSRGTRFVDNTVDGVKAGIEDVLANQEQLASGMEQLRQEKAVTWMQQRAELERRLAIARAEVA